MSDNGTFLLKGGKLIDPELEYEGEYDIFISERVIKRIEREISLKERVEEIDLSGKYVAPGLIDIRFHLSEPARMDREIVETASKASAMGGITTYCANPSESLVIDNQAIVDYLIERSEQVGYSQLLPVGNITKGGKGEALSEIKDMARLGIVAISDDKSSIMNSELMRRAMEYARSFNLPIFSFPEDKALARGGVMNESFTSLKMGLPAIPSIAETVMVVRDLILAEMMDIPIHISSVSTYESVELIKRAKNDGIRVTCDTSPHYFLLTDTSCLGYKTFSKVSPPLRSERDTSAVKTGIIDGTIDIITSDHTPLTMIDKDTEFQTALNGISGVETLFSLSYDDLVVNGGLSESGFISCLTLNPAELLQSEEMGRLKVGFPANLIVYDPDFNYKVDKKKFISKGKNTPFNERSVKGKIIMTIFNGKVVVKNGELVE